MPEVELRKQIALLEAQLPVLRAVAASALDRAEQLNGALVAVRSAYYVAAERGRRAQAELDACTRQIQSWKDRLLFLEKATD
jgi:hypothetical protein